MMKNMKELGKGSVIVCGKKASLLRCVSGSLWVTGRNDSRDILVCCGQTLPLGNLRGLCIQALESSEYIIT